MKQRSMTSGNIVQLLILFTLPLLIGNIFQQFYSMADTFIVGRTIGVDALAAVGCTGFPSVWPSVMAPAMRKAYAGALPAVRCSPWLPL